MDEHVGKALDHLIQNKLLFAGRYELQPVQRRVGAHGTVQMAHTSHSQARPFCTAGPLVNQSPAQQRCEHC
jgi:hypothetical protein